MTTPRTHEILPPNTTRGAATQHQAEPSYEAGTMYDHLSDEDFDGLECACGRRMHASDVECERCWRDREYPDA